MVEDGEMEMNGTHYLYHWSSDFTSGLPALPRKEGDPSRRDRCGWQWVSPLTAASRFRGHRAFGHQVSFTPNAETFNWGIYDPSVDGGPARICATFNSTRVIIDHLSFTEATVADVIAEFKSVSSIAAERFRNPTWEGGAYQSPNDKICEGGYFYTDNEKPIILQFAVKKVGQKPFEISTKSGFGLYTGRRFKSKLAPSASCVELATELGRLSRSSDLTQNIYREIENNDDDEPISSWQRINMDNSWGALGHDIFWGHATHNQVNWAVGGAR
jgi:hypothetical protein